MGFLLSLLRFHLDSSSITHYILGVLLIQHIFHSQPFLLQKNQKTPQKRKTAKPVQSWVVADSPCSRTCWCSCGHSSGSVPGSSGLEPPSPSGPRASRCTLSRRSTSTVDDTKCIGRLRAVREDFKWTASDRLFGSPHARCSYLRLDDVPGVAQAQVGLRVVQSQAVLQILLGVLAHLRRRDHISLWCKGLG